MFKTILVPGLNSVSTPKAMGMALTVARLFEMPAPEQGQG